MRSEQTYTYKTVAFPSVLSSSALQGAAGAGVAAKLERLINHGARDGWEYWRSEAFAVQEKASLGGFLRLWINSAQPIRYKVLVFRRPA